VVIVVVVGIFHNESKLSTSAKRSDAIIMILCVVLTENKGLFSSVQSLSIVRLKDTEMGRYEIHTRSSAAGTSLDQTQ
jgi:hypothetical protein